jgi:hypothetical protein
MNLATSVAVFLLSSFCCLAQILLVGETEKAKILADSSDLLNQLCSYRKYLCLNGGSPEHH